MTASFMGVAITPATVKDGTLKGAFDPILKPGTTGFGATVLTGSAKAGSTATGPTISSAVQAATGGHLAPGTYVYTVSAVGALGEGRRGASSTVVVAAALGAPTQAATSVTSADSGIWGATGDYYYTVTAINALGETVASNEQSATVAATTDSVTVSWAAVTGATGYKVYRGTAAGSEDHLVGTVGLVLSYKDHGNTGTAATPPVSDTTATTTNKVTLTWGAITGASQGYKVYRGGLHLADVAAGTTTYQDSTTTTPSGAAPTTGFAPITHEGADLPGPVDGGEV